MPKATPPVMIELVSAQKSTVSQSHPVIEIDLGPSSDIRTELASLLHRQKWASESSVFDNDITRLRASLGDRNYANLMPLLAGIDSLGRTPSAIRLSNFGDIRVQLGFDHICGDIVYSKPPRRKKADSKKDDKPKAPFVPQPRSLATTSNGRKAIRSAIESVSWVKNALFYDYHTRFEFAGAPTKITFALQATGDDVVRLDELITALRKAGFPPKSLTVSRRFPGIPFGKPLPENLELTTLEGKTRTLGSFAQAKRPLVVAFVQLNTKTRSKYHKYKAKPEYYHRFGKTIEKFGDRVDFVAISSNKHDTFGEAVKFWEQTGLTIPLLHDADRRCGDAFNVQITPPPHIFVFDSERRLRYAGDAHDNWEKPEAKYEDYLANALDKVFANKFLKNGAVFYNKSPCNCSHPKCKCPKCGCGSSCRCAIKHCGVGF